MISIILKIITITIMLVTRLTMSTPMWFSVGAAVTTITREAKIEMVIFLFILCWTILDIFRYGRSCLSLTKNLAWTPISFPRWAYSMFWAKSNDQTDCWLSKWLPKNHCCWCTIEVEARAACQCRSPWSTLSLGRWLGVQDHWGDYFSWGVPGSPRPLRWSSVVIGRDCDHGINWL